MPEPPQLNNPSELRLRSEDREKVIDLTAELIAVEVYRELQRANDLVRAAGCAIIGNCSNGSCNIIGNCSSSSRDELAERIK
jgi:hypothetical protein